MKINRNNYEEYFLLYIDRELSADERQVLESFVRRHPDLEKELERLKQTVAIPPVIVFENKNSLLREEMKRRFLPIYWMRIAASLIILLAGAGAILMIIPSKNASLRQMAEQIKKQSTGKHGDQIKKPSPGMIAGKVNHYGEKTKLQIAQNDNSYPAHATEPGSQNNAKKSALLPDLARHSGVRDTTIPNFKSSALLPSTINHQPSTILPSTINDSSINHQPSTVNRSSINHQPSTINDSSATSILVFDNKSKPMTGFFKKLLARSSDDDAVAGSHQKKVSVSIFQFSMSK